MQWDKVVEMLEGITIDKQGLVRDLSNYCPNAGSFLDQFISKTQEMICKECGIEGWTDTLIDTIKSMVR